MTCHPRQQVVVATHASTPFTQTHHPPYPRYRRQHTSCASTLPTTPTYMRNAHIKSVNFRVDVNFPSASPQKSLNFSNIKCNQMRKVWLLHNCKFSHFSEYYVKRHFLNHHNFIIIILLIFDGLLIALSRIIALMITNSKKCK